MTTSMLVYEFFQGQLHSQRSPSLTSDAHQVILLYKKAWNMTEKIFKAYS